MKKKKNSVKRLLFIYFMILFGTTVFSLFLIGVYSLWTYHQQVQLSNSAALDVYAYELESEMSDLVAFNQDTYVNNFNFKILSINNTAANKLVYEYNLRKTLKDRVPSYGAILIFDDTDDISMYKFGSGFKSSDTLACMKLNEKLKNYWRTADQSQLYSWQTYNDGNNSLIMNTYKLNNLYVCSIIDLGKVVILNYDSRNKISLQFAFYNDKQILSNESRLKELGVSIEDIKKNIYPMFFFTNRYLIQKTPIRNSDISISCIMPLKYLWNYSLVSIIFIIIVYLALCGLILIVFTKLRNRMVYPLYQMASNTEHLEKDDEENIHLSDQSKTEELQKINNALNHLIQQKVSLKKENLEKKQEKEHAQLQYFQLQTRSHFYINCLKSLYNMLENKEYEKMQRMIIAFSNHLRYIFHDNLALVPLKSELEEVKDYYDIILMDRVKPFIISRNVDEKLMDYMVPSLLIQTFLENSYKYNGKVEKTLRFIIQIDSVVLNDKPYIRIRLSDNGVGYSKDMLDKLNLEEQDTYENYHVGISNLKKRIQLIYQSDYQIAFYNEPAGGACTLICLPMRTENSAYEG